MAVMSRAEIIAIAAANDAFRQTFDGGPIRFAPILYHLPRWFRGAVMFSITTCHFFFDTERSEGLCSTYGFVIHWKIERPDNSEPLLSIGPWDGVL